MMSWLYGAVWVTTRALETFIVALKSLWWSTGEIFRERARRLKVCRVLEDQLLAQ